MAGFPEDVFGHERFEGDFDDWQQVDDEFHGSLGGMRLKIRIRQRDERTFWCQLSHFVEFQPDAIKPDGDASSIERFFESRKSALLGSLAELWRANRREDKVGTWQVNPDW